VDVIVSDHHHPGTDLPPAVAVIDPKQTGDTYPEKFLAGVGLAYKLAQAYLESYPQEGVNADDWLDLVAIGTVADLAPLRGENRMLVKKGLEQIRQSPRQGVFPPAQAEGIFIVWHNCLYFNGICPHWEITRILMQHQNDENATLTHRL